MKIAIHWLRRDLRLDDNRALNAALASGMPVLPLFIFDDAILSSLPHEDARVTFIHDTITRMNTELAVRGSGVLVMKGDALEVWETLLTKYDVGAVFFARDHEPEAMARDARVAAMLAARGVRVQDVSDQVIFERSDILKDDGTPYTVFTPYKNRWLRTFDAAKHAPQALECRGAFVRERREMPSLEALGFRRSRITVPAFDKARIKGYAETRDLPSLGTTHLGPHLRFGTVSVRRVISELAAGDEVFMSELIWREFFMQILFHFPHVVTRSFKPQYDRILWRNNEEEFEAWKRGETGYPMVDAGMRELNTTGFMHNRVRMVVASFLCKHLLIDWRWGEAYFAAQLLDFELSSNNGNWQWAAGTGCDAAPYFRIFNPSEQLRKFDPKLLYVKRWVPEYGGFGYAEPIVEHTMARERALETYKRGLGVQV